VDKLAASCNLPQVMLLFVFQFGEAVDKLAASSNLPQVMLLFVFQFGEAVENLPQVVLLFVLIKIGSRSTTCGKLQLAASYATYSATILTVQC
jgi:hypothetical protein